MFGNTKLGITLTQGFYRNYMEDEFLYWKSDDGNYVIAGIHTCIHIYIYICVCAYVHTYNDILNINRKHNKHKHKIAHEDKP